MLISCLIVTHYPLLDAFLRCFKIYMDFSVCTSLCSKNAKFYCIQRCPCISTSKVSQKVQCLLTDFCMITAQSLNRICNSPVQKFSDILFFQRFQFKNNGTGQQRTVYLKIRIFCGSTNQYQRTVFYKRQQIILLSLVKPVDLVYEQNRLFPVHSKMLLRFFYHFLHIFFSGCGRIQLGKSCACRVGDHFRQRGFSGSGRTVKNNRSQFVCLDRTVQQFVFADNMFLPNHFLQRRRPHSRCQRRLIFQRGFFHIIK